MTFRWTTAGSMSCVPAEWVHSIAEAANGRRRLCRELEECREPEERTRHKLNEGWPRNGAGGQPTGAISMPDQAGNKRPSTWRYASAPTSQEPHKSRVSLAVAALAAILGGVQPNNGDAQVSEQVRISVSATILARPGSQTSLEIGIVPPKALPTRSFVSLRGLPVAVSLTNGHEIGAGAWTVPITALGVLKANIPDSISGRSEIVIRLISMEGSLLATAKTALVIEPPTMVSPAAPTKLEPQPPTENTLLLPTPL